MISEMGDVAREPSLHLPGRKEGDKVRDIRDESSEYFCGELGERRVKCGSNSSIETNPPSFQSLALQACPSKVSPHVLSYMAQPRARGWRSSGSCRRCRGRTCCCITFFVLGFVALFSGICLALLWPRDPKWTLRELDVSETDLMKLVTILSANDLNVAALQSLQLNLEMDVEVFNPNFFMTFSASEGLVELRYGTGSNGTFLGEGKSQPVTVEPQRTEIFMADLHLRKLQSEDFIKSIHREIAFQRFVLPFNLFATCTLQMFNMELHYQVFCELYLNLSNFMMPETRNKAMAARNCQHRLNFL